MNKWKVFSIMMISGILIALNVYLLVKDDSKANRSVQIEEWRKVNKGSIAKTFDVKGVVKPMDESYIYFSTENKEFKKFLVKEGDYVSIGTPLFEYTSPKMKETENKLEAEKAEVEGEISSVAEYITKLMSYQSTITSSSTIIRNLETEEELQLDSRTSEEMITSAIEQEIYKQEMARTKLENKIASLDAQLAFMGKETGFAIYASELEGLVKKVDNSLGNPLVTIVSNVYGVEGAFSESGLKETEEGMKIMVSSPSIKKKISGTLVKVFDYPVNEPDINKTSQYPFHVGLEEVPKDLKIGAKVTGEIITEEADGVLVISEKAVAKKSEKTFVRGLKDGKIHHIAVKTGIQAEGKIQINRGLKKGDTVVLLPKEVPVKKSDFITPVQTEDVTWRAVKDMSKKDKLHFILVGLFEK